MTFWPPGIVSNQCKPGSNEISVSFLGQTCRMGMPWKYTRTCHTINKVYMHIKIAQTAGDYYLKNYRWNSGSVADPDPGSGAFLTSGSSIRDPE